MKQFLTLFFIVLSLLSFSCKDEIINNVYVPDTSEKGNVIVNSTPSGLKIYLENTFTGKITPDTLVGLSVGSYNISVKPADYASLSYEAKVKSNVSSTIDFPVNELMGKVYVTSYPDSCEIFINSINTGKVTPDTIDYIRLYNYDKITLKKGSMVFISELYASGGKVITRDFDLSTRINIESSPSGAKIFLDTTYTGKRTPAQLTKLMPGEYNFTLKLQGYMDTSFSVITSPGVGYSEYITLQDSLKLNSFDPVRIYASSSRVQGIDLSSGTAYTANNGYSYIDIYYKNDGINISGAQGLGYRSAYLLAGGNNDLLDGEDSPDSYYYYWGSTVPTDLTDYFFIRDYDSHYSKMIITDKGGSGTTADPKWVEVKWLYNTKSNDKRF